MFDPDNFYEILRCSYSWPKTQNIIFSFRVHGSKDLLDLSPLINGKEEQLWLNEFNPGDQTAFGKIVLHDQEPFSLSGAAFTYKQFLYNHKNYPKFQEIVKLLDPVDLISCCLRTGMFPILCHSEKNSIDVKSVVDSGSMIDCYYWYHAMIARDWFRHWQYHPDLVPRDRSMSRYRFMMYAREFTGTRTYRKKFVDHMRSYKNDILYNWEDHVSVPSNYSAKIAVDDANQSAIHVVLETLFDTEKIHLTEKVFKPMVMSQPFFLLAGPGSLNYLREYGFRTFGDFWDESYDLVVDSDERMRLIEKEIDRIINLSQEEFADLYQSLLPTIEHNRQHFFSQVFQDFCIREMQTNFKIALDQQQNVHTQYPGGSWARIMAKLTETGLFVPEGWQNNMREFLRTPYLSVPSQDVILKYPVLAKYQD